MVSQLNIELKSNPINNMTEEQKQNLELACQALEANPLQAVKQMRSNHGGKCCLAVMADTACQIKGLEQGELDENESFPKASIAEVFGLTNDLGSSSLKFDFNLDGEFASVHNDGDPEEGIAQKSHQEIAAMIRKQYLAEQP